MYLHKTILKSTNITFTEILTLLVNTIDCLGKIVNFTGWMMLEDWTPVLILWDVAIVTRYLVLE